MQQVLVGRIERVIDFEILGACKDCSGDVEVAGEVSRPTAAA